MGNRREQHDDAQGPPVFLPVLVALAVLGLGAWIVIGSPSATDATWIGAAIVFIVGGFGLLLVLRYPGTSWVDVGTGLLMGSVVSLAVGTGQYALEQKRKERDDRQALRLTLSLSHDLRDVDLNGDNLSGFLLAHKNMAGAAMRGARLTGTSLVGTNLGGADLSGADLRKADLTDADLTRANLGGADLRGAVLTDATMRQSRISRARLQDAMLEGADIQYACLADAHLERADLAGAALRGALLMRSHLGGARFVSQDGRAATLTGASLLHATQDRDTRWPPAVASEIADRISGKSSKPEPTSSVPRPTGASSARVTTVEDGDSITLGGVGDVRLLGLNAPDGSEEMGRAATGFLRRLLPAGTPVSYTYDRQHKDTLGRKLLYVWLSNGTFVNSLLVDHGYASLQNFRDDIRYARLISEAEFRARSASRGIWRSCPQV